MFQDTTLDDKEAGQGKDDHPGWQGQISRARQADDHADKAGGCGPKKEQLDPDRTTSPNKETQGEESGDLQDARQRRAGVQGPGDQSEIGHGQLAVRQPQLPGQIRHRMERQHRGELGHGQEYLGDGKGEKHANQEPTRPRPAQVPGHGQINAEGPKQQPGVLPGGVGIKTGGLAPK